LHIAKAPIATEHRNSRTGQAREIEGEVHILAPIFALALSLLASDTDDDETPNALLNDQKRAEFTELVPSAACAIRRTPGYLCPSPRKGKKPGSAPWALRFAAMWPKKLRRPTPAIEHTWAAVLPEFS
jgi:hypothetical protein